MLIHALSPPSLVTFFTHEKTHERTAHQVHDNLNNLITPVRPRRPKRQTRYAGVSSPVPSGFDVVTQ